MPDENGISTITTRTDADGNVTIIGDEMPSLEAMLQSSLQDSCSSSRDLLELLEDLVITKWDDFFETLGLELSAGSVDTMALFSQTLNSLERNLGVSRQRHKVKHRPVEMLPDTYPLLTTKSATAEWEVLLSQLDRRAQLLHHLSPVIPSVEIPVRRLSAETNAAADLGILPADARGAPCNSKSGENRNGDMDLSTSDENQRSLNRVAYLGGVLLPFSIVSGILAIQEPYGPGNSQFWVFWAVTVPLVLITLAVMYADSIRKAEVWIEVTTASGNSNDPGTGSDLPGSSLSIPDLEFSLPARLSAQPIFFSPPPAAVVVEDGDDTNVDGRQGEPDRIVEKRHWRNTAAQHDTEAGPSKAEWARKKKWRKEQLGWMGAFATLFRLYKVKKGAPPGHLRRG
ncbi:hypothetical protein ONZ43_g3977 [Nemania bipapillata]|uniref:Uncharacterized protein n=1 Tax=Nemania bipapillata TaxID=110536 RepID=A0ACC2ITD9_9PEZI|nr:hypothetical protein ONZ43_g3977 [Nemania bipapillata]